MSRVLLVSNDRPAFSARLPLVEALRAAGHEVEAALPPGPPIPGLTTYDWPLDRRGLNPLREAVALRRLIHLYRTVKPDLVHHFTVKAIVYGGLAARRARVPAVHTVTGLGYVFIAGGPGRRLLRVGVESLLRAALRHAAAVMFQNRDDRDLFVARRLVRAGVTRVVPGSGVDLAHFRPTPEPEGPVVVAYLGRFLVDKGVREFVAAADALRGDGLRLRLVGDVDPGNPASVDADEVALWSDTGAVEVRPWRAEVRAELDAVHVVCLPSYREGVPRVLLEAAACGRPAVATDVPGCRDVIVDGQTGLLVPARDAGALAQAIRRLARDAPLRARMGDAARRLAEDRFGNTVVHALTLQAYADALAQVARAR